MNKIYAMKGLNVNVNVSSIFHRFIPAEPRITIAGDWNCEEELHNRKCCLNAQHIVSIHGFQWQKLILCYDIFPVNSGVSIQTKAMYFDK